MRSGTSEQSILWSGFAASFLRERSWDVESGFAKRSSAGIRTSLGIVVGLRFCIGFRFRSCATMMERMADSYLRLIPGRPEFVPGEERIPGAIRLIGEWFGDVDVRWRLDEGISFVDPGGNLERVSCPRCSSDVTGLWGQWMDASYDSGFRNRMVRLPCCGLDVDLHDLVYEWPAGFAQFVIEIGPGAGQFLPQKYCAELEDQLGSSIRQVLTRV